MRSCLEILSSHTVQVLNQSADSTGGSIVSECKLGKTGTLDCFISPLTSCNFKKKKKKKKTVQT